MCVRRPCDRRRSNQLFLLRTTMSCPSRSRIPCRTAILAAITALPTMLAAQADPALGAAVAAAAFESLSPITAEPAGTDGAGGGIWGGGSNYKASFHDGMTFYPHVGADLPHQPFAWRTVSVRAGSVELLPNAAQPKPIHGDRRCEYHLGPVTERYELELRGLEQSFVVNHRPPAGDLVIRGRVTTPLALAPQAARHGDLVLRLADGRAVVDYGAAFAIDATGRRTAVATACDGDGITLTVPAEVVAQAAFPLVVDPLLGNVLLESGAPVEDVDVLHETITPVADAARLWLGYSRTVAAGDSDLWVKRIGDNFVGTLIDAYQKVTLDSDSDVQMALAPAASRVVIVHTHTNSPITTIAVHRHDTFDLVLRTSFTTPFATPVTSEWRPDVGGRIGINGSQVLMLFQRELALPFANTATSTVYASIYDASQPTGSAVVVPAFAVLNRPNADQERPVCNQGAAGNHWVVAFQENLGNIVNDDWDVLTVSIDNLGAVSPTPVTTAQGGNPLVHAVAPQLAGSNGRYLLAYTTRAFQLMNPKPQAAAGDTVWAQRIDWDHTTDIGSKPHPVVSLQTNTANELVATSSAFDDTSKSHWLVINSDSGANNYRLRKLGYTGNLVEARSYTPFTGTSIVDMATTFDGASRQFPLLFGQTNATAGTGSIQANVLQYVGVPAPTLVGFACGSGVWGGLNATADRQQLGSEDMPLKLVNAPQDTAALLIVSTAEGNLPGDLFGAPGCLLVPDIVSAAFLGILSAPITGGVAQLSLDLPEYLTPFPLSVQWAYIVPNVNPAWLQASEGLRIAVDR